MHSLAMATEEEMIAAPYDSLETAAKFKALGDPTRLRIFQFLRRQVRPVAVSDNGDVRTVNGPTVGEVCCFVTGKERITSTISEHLKELRQAGLIVMERRGKNMICAINPAEIVSLNEFFATDPVVMEECCTVENS